MPLLHISNQLKIPCDLFSIYNERNRSKNEVVLLKCDVSTVFCRHIFRLSNNFIKITWPRRVLGADWSPCTLKVMEGSIFCVHPLKSTFWPLISGCVPVQHTKQKFAEASQARLIKIRVLKAWHHSSKYYRACKRKLCWAKHIHWWSIQGLARMVEVYPSSSMAGDLSHTEPIPMKSCGVVAFKGKCIPWWLSMEEHVQGRFNSVGAGDWAWIQQIRTKGHIMSASIPIYLSI